jgi:transketolase
LVTETLARRPAVVVPFVTRPPQTIIDREKAGLAPAREATRGVYRLVRAATDDAGVVVLQGSGVTRAFVEEALPRLREDGIDLNVYCVASAELFDMLPFDEQQETFPELHAYRAIGITGFTMPTLYRWVRSDRGRALSLHPFSKGHFPGSGHAQMVLAEAGLDGEGQVRAIERYVEARW